VLNVEKITSNALL